MANLVIIDDDWAEWFVDNGGANYEFTDDSSIQKHGTNCFKVRITSDNGGIDFVHNYSNPLDLSSYNYISFWFYGIGNNDLWDVGIAYDEVGYKRLDWNDTTVGWSLITFKMSDAEDVNWSNITAIEFFNNTWTLSSGTTYYFDFLIATVSPTPTPTPIGGGGANILDETNREETFSSLTPEQQKAYLDAKKRLVEESEQRLQSEQK